MKLIWRIVFRKRFIFLLMSIAFIFVILKNGVDKTAQTSDLQKISPSFIEPAKETVLFVVAITTAPSRRARRDAIRSTYWRYCYNNTKSIIRCFFFTDRNVKMGVLPNLQKESLKNKDMILQPTGEGLRFGLRFLHQIQWISRRFNFSYFLHADDDYFICLNGLTNELQYRPQRNLVWGYFYCYENLVYVDEAWILFSSDVIKQFLAQDSSRMLCHPHADQQIATWLNEIPSRFYFHDRRLHHYPRATDKTYLNTLTDICSKYLGVHRTYEREMLLYDQRSNDVPKELLSVETPDYRSLCPHWGFNWTLMWSYYRYRPKPCKDAPGWGLGDKYWRGAEENPLNF